MKRGNYVLVLLPVVFEACFPGMFNGRFHLHTSRRARASVWVGEPVCVYIRVNRVSRGSNLRPHYRVYLKIIIAFFKCLQRGREI